SVVVFETESFGNAAQIGTVQNLRTNVSVFTHYIGNAIAGGDIVKGKETELTDLAVTVRIRVLERPAGAVGGRVGKARVGKDRRGLYWVRNGGGHRPRSRDRG